MLDNVALKDLLGNVVTSAAHREAAAQLRSAYDMSGRWPGPGPGPDELALSGNQGARHGVARAAEHAGAEAAAVRLKLTVRRRGGRKRAMGTRRPIEVPLQADQALEPGVGFAGAWLVSDQMTDRRRFRILTVVDNCTRERLALTDTSIFGRRVARELDRQCSSVGAPRLSSATTARS